MRCGRSTDVLSKNGAADRSSGLVMVVAELSFESLPPFNYGVEVAKGGERL